MSNLGRKRLPFSKTVVLEYRAVLADVLARSMRMKGSIAIPIHDSHEFNNGDVNVSDEHPYEFSPTSIFVLNSFDPVLVEITQYSPNPDPTLPALESVTKIRSEGFLALAGSCYGRIRVTPTISQSKVRLQYLWS